MVWTYYFIIFYMLTLTLFMISLKKMQALHFVTADWYYVYWKVD